MKRPNTSASVRQRLLNLARADQRPFNELLQYYAMERFLFRLSKSEHKARFVLKGAMMMRVWGTDGHRPTMDIDLLGRTSNAEAALAQQVRDVLAAPVTPDGLAFDPNSVRTERITEDADYEGLRIRFLGKLDSARIHMQVDIGFGDVVYPAPNEADIPTLLNGPKPRLFCYSRESAIAEKIEAMVKLGELNSRLKDFYDVWQLSRQFQFSGHRLMEALRLTFEQRQTKMPASIPVFGDQFAVQKQAQWAAFHRRLRQPHVPKTFATVVLDLKEFLGPLTEALATGTPPPDHWPPPGPWQ